MLSATEYLPDQPSICDTVVVNYFLASGQIALLARLLGGIRVPAAVYDPAEEATTPENLRSELARGLLLHRDRVRDDTVPEYLRERSRLALPHFESLEGLAAAGTVEVIHLDAAELTTFAELRDATVVAEKYGLATGLGLGEASALAVSHHRDWIPVTDDGDAVKVAAVLVPAHRPLRIRALLALAAERGVIGLDEARVIHEHMKTLGFWDRGSI